MMKKIFPLILALALPFFCACHPEEPVDTYEATIKFPFGSNLDIAALEGSTATFQFTCDHEWRLEMDDEASAWLHPNKTEGAVKKVLTIKFTADVNTGAARTAQCRIVSGASSKDFTVTQQQVAIVLSASDVQDLDKFYQPAEFNYDLLRSDSRWSWCRSKQSEHFVVFWDAKYGEYGLYGERLGQANTSPSTCKKSSMKVDIDDLLKKAEEFYDLNVNRLGFARTGKGQSVLDKYKMQIYILYQDEWLATGSGYDNTIGALWVNPSTCQPVGSTIGHEIGHSFQYMTFCDYLLQQGIEGDAAINAKTNQGPGWRYGFGASGAGGNAFWEQTAQWQSFQLEKYRSGAFSGWYSEYTTSAYLHVIHERPRYANYFIHWWWVEETGDISFIGRLWNEAEYPEDPVETYMRLMGYDVEAMNNSMWQYAAHMLTYDTEELRNYGKNNIGATAITNISKNAEDWWEIAASKAPETTGSNAIRMTIPSDNKVSVTLEHNLGISGCVSGSITQAGWRYGFVAYGGGRTYYSPVWSATGEQQTWDVPAGASKLWLVVTGAPTKYERHAWSDESDSKDTKWPWKAKFEGTKPYGK